MSRPLLFCALSAALSLMTESAVATERAFAYARESGVEAAGQTELVPWTTFRGGRERYYSALDARLELEHGLTRALQFALYWNFTSESRDVVSSLGTIERVSRSELASASFELKYQLSDPAADALGSALYLETTLGPRATELEAELIADRAFGKWLLAANLGAEYELVPTRNPEGTELETALVLEPALGAAYALGQALRLGLELRSPIGASGDAKSAPLFGGPTLSFADGGFWGVLAVQPQLLALTGQSSDSHLALARHEKLQVRLLLGMEL